MKLNGDLVAIVEFWMLNRQAKATPPRAQRFLHSPDSTAPPRYSLDPLKPF